jgi:cytochrome c oxidase subunit 2
MAISSEAASSVATVSSAAASSEQAVQARVIVVSADNFSFNPSTINAKKGEKVILRIKGVAGIHGFGIPDLGVNVRVDAGGSVDVELPTDTAGSFAFRCTIPCGGGHKSMVGTIVIS